MVSRTQLRLIALGATTALGVAALTWQRHEKRGRGLLFRPSTGTLVDAARSLNRGAGLLATSVALDSGLEHYRGDFRNRAMYTPLVTSTLRCWPAGRASRTRTPSPARCATPSTCWLG